MNLSKQQCQHLIDLAESTYGWNPVIWGKTKYLTAPFKNFQIDDITNIIKQYCSENLNLEVDNVNICVLKYEKGWRFERHRDYGGNEFTGDYLYNINVLLNNEYEGGEFYLEDKPYIKPVGEIYHYESSKYHEVKQIKDGTRYSCLFYVRHRDIKNNKKTVI